MAMHPLLQASKRRHKKGRSQSRCNPVRPPAALVQIPAAQARNHVQGDGDPACWCGEDLSFRGRHKDKSFRALSWASTETMHRAPLKLRFKPLSPKPKARSASEANRLSDLAIGSKERRTGGTALGTQSDGLRQGPARSKAGDQPRRKAVTAAIALHQWAREGGRFIATPRKTETPCSTFRSNQRMGSWVQLLRLHPLTGIKATTNQGVEGHLGQALSMPSRGTSLIRATTSQRRRSRLPVSAI